MAVINSNSWTDLVDFLHYMHMSSGIASFTRVTNDWPTCDSMT